MPKIEKMKKIFLALFVTACTSMLAQTDGCEALLNALPTPESYGKYKMAQFPECFDGYVTAYYSYGEADNEQLFSVMLTDTKHEANTGMLADAQSKHQMALKSNDKTALKVSRFKMGSHSLVAHDVNTGVKRIYGYKVILKNRYVLDVMANSDTITNLDQFQDFIAGYIATIKEHALFD
jgi:hypothetical protein